MRWWSLSSVRGCSPVWNNLWSRSRPAWCEASSERWPRQYVAGLASQVKRKNVESIAYHHDQDRQMLQKFIGQYTWDHWPLVGGTGAASGRAHLPRRLGRRSTCASGDKGPLVVEAAKVLVRAKTSPRQGYDEMLIVVRERQSDGSMKHDYYLSNAPSDTPLAEFTRVAKAAHRIEECLHRDKSEAGLADYEVRTWRGWHHHQTLSLLATWFLTQETRRGKKIHTGHYRPANSSAAGFVAA